MRRQLRRGRGLTPGECFGELCVQLLALAGQDRRVDRLGEQGVAETESAGCLDRDQDRVVDRLPERVVDLVLRELGQCQQQRIADVAPGGRGQPQHVLRSSVELGHTLEQQVTQAARELARPIVLLGGREELFGEERVALATSDDRLGQCSERGSGSVRRQQRSHLVRVERSEFEREP